MLIKASILAATSQCLRENDTKSLTFALYTLF